MSIKTLLGLENFNLSDSEIIKQIYEARLKKIKVLEFHSKERKVSINLGKLSKEGIMWGNLNYYKIKN